jgi:hypothetical protein
MPPPPLVAQFFEWHVQKETRAFRVYVVEPAVFDPPDGIQRFIDIFDGAITSLLSSGPPITRDSGSVRNAPVSDRFDLLIFPEAFLPWDHLPASLERIHGLDRFGCVHVGLRSAQDRSTHLIGTAELQTMLHTLSTVAGVRKSDLDAILAWAADREPGDHYNLACLFAVDAAGELRVCVHPKMVRSRFEISQLPERTMTEANVISLISLVPADGAFSRVVLQPLICSDALELQTDVPWRRPLEIINQHTDKIGAPVPDHVEIVSVVTCTPQYEAKSVGDEPVRWWHSDFRHTFTRAGRGGLDRHGQSIFALSNFRDLTTGGGPGTSPGGCSGGFMPVPLEMPAGVTLNDFVQVSTWGRDLPNPENNWSVPSHRSPPQSRESLGHIISLDSSYGNDADAQMFGFTISRFPRDVAAWKPQQGFINLDLRSGRYEEGKIVFRKRDG